MNKCVKCGDPMLSERSFLEVIESVLRDSVSGATVAERVATFLAGLCPGCSEQKRKAA